MRQAVQNANMDLCMDTQTQRQRIIQFVKRGFLTASLTPGNPECGMFATRLYARFVFVVVRVCAFFGNVCFRVHVHVI